MSYAAIDREIVRRLAGGLPLTQKPYDAVAQAVGVAPDLVRTRIAAMDHFAKPGDELAVALREGKLHRNFQGYSTRPDCDLLAFGISAIGKVGATYVQNVKTLDKYYEALDERRLPVMRGIALEEDDLLRREVIQKLMCEFRLDYGALERTHGIRFGERFATELAALAPLAADGLVTLAPDGLEVTLRGRMLVRTVAMLFDRHLREARERATYSRVI